MSVYYQTSPPASPPRTYYPGSWRGSLFGSDYARPYSAYAGAPYNYYAPSPGYYQPGAVMTVAQPRYTAPMAYQLYRGNQRYPYYGYPYQDDDCCGCDGSGRCCGVYCCGPDPRYASYGYGRDDEGCCGCFGGRHSHHSHSHRSRYRRRDGCC